MLLFLFFLLNFLFQINIQSRKMKLGIACLLVITDCVALDTCTHMQMPPSESPEHLYRKLLITSCGSMFLTESTCSTFCSVLVEMNHQRVQGQQSIIGFMVDQINLLLLMNMIALDYIITKLRPRNFSGNRTHASKITFSFLKLFVPTASELVRWA